jgi:hypothetical protein
MADAKISDLASGSPPAAGDLMLIARSGANYYLSLSNLFSRPLEIGANAPNAARFTKVAVGGAPVDNYAYRAVDGFGVGSAQVAFYTDINEGATAYAFYGSGTATSRLNGSMSIGGAAISGAVMTITAASTFAGADWQTATIGGGFYSSVTGPATMTTLLAGALVNVASVAAAYTLTNAVGYYASAFTKGAGSTITNVFGFYTDNTIVVGTNNYGYYANISSASNTYGFYAAGTAVSYFGGPVGILTNAPMATYAAQLAVIGTHQGTATTGQGIYQSCTVPATNTANFYGIRSAVHTAAAAFTLNNATLFLANTVTKGAGSTITSVYGFWASSALGGVATNTYGFYSDIADASATYQLAMAGTAPSYFSGSVGVGAAPTNTSVVLHVRQTATMTANTLNGVYNDMTAPSTCTLGMYAFRSIASTQAAAFTLTELTHFFAQGSALGAGSAVTSVMGFYASNTMVRGTNNFGFYSNISTAATTYQFYMAGTANCYIGSTLNIRNVTTNQDVLFRIGTTTHPNTGASSYVVYIDVTAPSTSTTLLHGYGSILRTTAAAFTLPTVIHFYANTTGLGAGSTISNVFGFRADNNIVAGSSSNYGFYSGINAATSTWAFYSAGSAESFFAGPVGIFSNNTPLASGALLRMGNGSAVHPSSTTSIDGISLTFSAPTTATSNQRGITVGLQTQASAYTVSNQVYFQAGVSASKGAGSTINNAYGFYALNNMAQAANNYGFYSDIATASNTYQFYAAGTAPNFFNGITSIGGGVIPTAYTLLVTPHTQMSAASAYVIGVNGTMPTSAATNAGAMNIALTLSNATAYGNVFGIYISGLTLGTATAVVSYGVRVNNAIAVATTNYGFYSDIASASNTYQLYMVGTAASYIKGPLYVGGAVSTLDTYQLYIGGTHPATITTPQVLNITTAFPSTATGNTYGVQMSLSTAAAAFTMATLRMFEATQVTLGAGSAITTVYGFMARNAIAVGGTNIGFYSDINSATNTYQLYMGGTAASYFGTGANYFGSTTAAVADATARIQLNGATSNMIAWNTSGSAAPAFTTRSAGTKLVLYPNIGGATVDYAIGIEASNMWFSVQQQGAAVGWKFYGGTTLAMYISSAGFFEMYEAAAPSAGAANTARLFCRDNGAGKTQVCVIFNTGAVQVVATEP